MAKAIRWQELANKSDDEIIAEYDTIASGNVSLGLDFYRQEIALRSQDKTDKAILTYTKQVTVLTWVTTILSVLAVLIALFHH